MKIKKITILMAVLIVLTITSVSAANTTDMLQIDDANALTSEIEVNNNIQDAINNAKDGDTINLGTNKAYDIQNTTIEINKKITIKGENVNITAGSANGAFQIKGASNVEISGITFINPVDLPKFGDKFSGKAIYTQSSNNLLIKDCRFINYAYGLDIHTTSQSRIENCWFNGATTSISGMAGDGTKAIQLMGSNQINIINNTFEGQIYDGLSIASGSSYVNIENNTFINNTFPIFYGGASTQGGKIKNNRFITCGMLNTTWYSKNLNQVFNITYENLPYIGMQKASNNIEIIGNEFIVKDNNRIIYSEAENTAHGFPSVIGAINITGNTVKKTTPDVVDSTVTFYQVVVVSSLGINTMGDINVKDNNFTDIPNINHFQLDFQAIQNENHEVYIPSTTAGTKLIINYVKDGRVNVKLCDLSDNGITGETIRYTINNGAVKTAVTDEYGQIYIDDLSGDVKITASFYQTAKYSRSDITATLSMAPKATPAPVVTKKATTLTVAKKTFKKSATKKLTATLKSGGKAVKGKKITFKVNGKTYKATTNSKGVATVKIKLTKKGTYKYTAKFAGDSTYKGASKTSKVIVK